MRYYGTIILSTIRAAENDDISDAEYLSAKNAIPVFLMIFNDRDTLQSETIEASLQKKLNQVKNRKKPRKDIWSISTVENFIFKAIHEKESPRASRGL